MSDCPTIRPPISIKQLAIVLDIKVAELIAVLVFRMQMGGVTMQSQLDGGEVRRVAAELRRQIRIEGEDERNGGALRI